MYIEYILLFALTVKPLLIHKGIKPLNILHPPLILATALTIATPLAPIA